MLSFFLDERMKRLFVLLLLVLSLFSSCNKQEELKIGVAVYDFNDSFISEVRKAIVACSENDIPVTIVDAGGRQQKQNEQIEQLIKEGYSAIIINSVDRTASGVLIDKCMQNDVPLVFINREPVKDDMAKWDEVYYVGARAEDSGRMAGELMASYWLTHPEADKNNDGVMQYVVIKGETGHQDTELRTEYFIETLLEKNIMLEKLHEDTGDWSRSGGYDAMSSFILHSGDRIEAVFANNDDMALGALEALQENGYFSSKGFPMAATVTKKITGAEQEIEIRLERLIAKVELKINSSSLPGFRVNSVRLMNSPKDIVPFTTGSGAASTMTGDTATASDIAGLNAGKSATFYMLENCQGILLPGNKDQWEKVPENIPAEKEKLCTYMEVTADLDGSSGVEGPVTYRFYLGQDETTDFNIFRQWRGSICRDCIFAITAEIRIRYRKLHALFCTNELDSGYF